MVGFGRALESTSSRVKPLFFFYVLSALMGQVESRASLISLVWYLARAPWFAPQFLACLGRLRP